MRTNAAGVFAGVCLALSVPVRAQTPEAAVPRLEVGTQRSAALPSGNIERVKAGHRVWVTTKDGTVCRGKILSISQAAIDLGCVDGQRTIAVADIRTVERNDSVVNGMLYGMAAGAGVGALVGPTKYHGSDDVGALYGAVYAGLYAGIGAGVGLVIDALIEGRRVVYRAATSTARLTLAPVIARRGAGVEGVIRW